MIVVGRMLSPRGIKFLNGEELLGNEPIAAARVAMTADIANALRELWAS